MKIKVVNPGSSKVYLELFPTECPKHRDEYCKCERVPIGTFEVEPKETKMVSVVDNPNYATVLMERAKDDRYARNPEEAGSWL